MRLLIQLVSLRRARQLNRQFRDIQRSVRALSSQNRSRLAALTLREIGQATRCDFPHLYGTAPEARYLPWGQGTDIGFSRARSENVEIAICGVALWLAVAYHETKEARQAPLQTQYRQVMRLLRELKETGRGSNEAESWMRQSAAA